MAKVYNNDKRHLVIEISPGEATKLNFGIDITGLNNMFLCGSCNQEINPHNMYYICGINEVMCKDCLEDYVKTMNHYCDDDSLLYEAKHFNAVATKLGMKERATVSNNGKCVIYDIDKAKQFL